MNEFLKILSATEKLREKKKINLLWEGRDFNKADWLNDKDFKKQY